MEHNNNIPQTDIGLTQDPENQNIDVSDNVVWAENRDHKDKLRACAGYYCARVTAPGELLCTVHLS